MINSIQVVVSLLSDYSVIILHDLLPEPHMLSAIKSNMTERSKHLVARYSFILADVFTAKVIAIA